LITQRSILYRRMSMSCRSYYFPFQYCYYLLKYVKPWYIFITTRTRPRGSRIIIIVPKVKWPLIRVYAIYYIIICYVVLYCMIVLVNRETQNEWIIILRGSHSSVIQLNNASSLCVSLIISSMASAVRTHFIICVYVRKYIV